MKVVVAGAGIGGLAAALALARLGFVVEVVEQADALREVGAGLQLSPNATKVLAALDVLPATEAIASQPKTLELRRGKSGHRVFSIPMGAAALKRYGAPYLHVHRADFVDVLRAACEAAGVKLRFGSRVVAYVREGLGLRVGLDDGEVMDAGVLVGADGMHSSVRQQMLGDDHPRFTGAVAWRCLAPAEAVPDLPQGAIVWAGAGRHAVTYRVRRDELINFVGVVEERGWEEEGWNKAGHPDVLAELFEGWAKPVIEVIAAAGACHRWALFDRDPLPRWTDGPVALLGDACHLMPPFQAQGAAMAIEDAFVLARALNENQDAPAEALKRYEAARRPRTARVLASARGNMGVFHRSNFLSQTATYGPMRVADTLLPAFVRSRQDWIYAHDVTKL